MVQEAKTRTGTRGLQPFSLLLIFLGCMGLYVLFVGQFSKQELLLGTLCSLVCSAFSALLYRCAPPVRFKLSDVMEGWRVPRYVLQQVPQITWLLVRDFAGQRVGSLFKQIAFQGDACSPRDEGRRVLAVAYTSTSPGSIVLHVDPTRQKLHYHQIAPSEIGHITERLGEKS